MWVRKVLEEEVRKEVAFLRRGATKKTAEFVDVICERVRRNVERSSIFFVQFSVGLSGGGGGTGGSG